MVSNLYGLGSDNPGFGSALGAGGNALFPTTDMAPSVAKLYDPKDPKFMQARK